MLKMSEERREAEEERKRILANIEEHRLLEVEQQAEMKRVKCRELMMPTSDTTFYHIID